MIEILGFHSR